MFSRIRKRRRRRRKGRAKQKNCQVIKMSCFSTVVEETVEKERER